MNDGQDIRWKQRFQNYQKALSQLSKFIEKGDLNELEKQGLIQSFEYTYELAWNVMKDFFEAQGETDILGSRGAFRLAFKRGIVEDGETWMNMIKSRILSSHTYQEKIAEEIVSSILESYYAEFLKFETRMKALS
jgi:nucleotidyltransferase substrate binding protein (TIGR01987 family)